MYKDEFLRQVSLLLQCMPAIREQDTFALKGGTAINLFIQNLPRLSVDIDLTYVHLTDRETSLSNIQNGLREIAIAIKSLNPKFIIREQISKNSGFLLKLHIYDENTTIKIEPNFVSRGTVFPVTEGTICKRARDTFGIFIDKVPMLDAAEVYAGKICATLNRQHPRDLFDIYHLLQTGGITDNIRQAFVIYLAGDSRPIHEMLEPNRLDISKVFEREFNRITEQAITLEELHSTREQLITIINNSLTDNEREFLISVKQGKPRFELMPFNHIDQLPAIIWKQINIKKMQKDKHKMMLGKLERVLSI